MEIKTPEFMKGYKLIKKDNNPKYIIIHHALAKECTSKQINQWHLERGFQCIGYHYFINKKGNIDKLRPNTYHGAHCVENMMNIQSIGICLEGCYQEYGDQTDYEVPHEQLNSLVWLVKEIQKAWNIPLENVLPHRFWANYKKCPGNYFPWEKFIGLLILNNI